MALDLSAVSRPIGPLPLWAWGALAGGGAILFAHIKGSPAASSVLDPNNPAVTAPGDTGGAVNPSPVLEPGQTTGPSVSFSDLLGGQGLGDFLKGLGPNYTNVQITAGSLGASVSNSAQNILDEQSVLAQYHAAEVNNSNFYAAQIANNTNFWNAWSQYYHDRTGTGVPSPWGGVPPPATGPVGTYGWLPTRPAIG